MTLCDGEHYQVFVPPQGQEKRGWGRTGPNRQATRRRKLRTDQRGEREVSPKHQEAKKTAGSTNINQNKETRSARE